MDSLFTADQPDNNERDELLNRWKDKPVDELLKAKVESDLYIKTLERQKDELRQDYLRAHEDLKARNNLQELIDKLNTAQQTPQTPLLPPVESEKPAINLDDIQKVIDQRYEAKKLAEVEEVNFKEVQKKLQERYGQSAGAAVKEQANTLGLTEAEVNSLAKKSPEAFFRLLGLNQQAPEGYQAPIRSNLRSDNYAPYKVDRTWSYYQNLKKTNPNEYWKPTTQLQMHKDSERLGSKFEDGDYGVFG